MIIRAEVLTNSWEDPLRRVKLKSEGTYDETPLVESLNGLYLRKGEKVFVDVSAGFEAPLIIGRCGNWIDGDEILSLFNKLVDELNKTRQDVKKLQQLHDTHTHPYINVSAPAVTSPTSQQMTSSEVDMRSIKMSEIFHED